MSFAYCCSECNQTKLNHRYCTMINLDVFYLRTDNACHNFSSNNNSIVRFTHLGFFRYTQLICPKIKHIEIYLACRRISTMIATMIKLPLMKSTTVLFDFRVDVVGFISNRSEDVGELEGTFCDVASRFGSLLLGAAVPLTIDSYCDRLSRGLTVEQGNWTSSSLAYNAFNGSKLADKTSNAPTTSFLSCSCSLTCSRSAAIII